MRPFLVNRFFKERPKEVHRDMEGRLALRAASSFFTEAARSFWASSGVRGGGVPR